MQKLRWAIAVLVALGATVGLMTPAAATPKAKPSNTATKTLNDLAKEQGISLPSENNCDEIKSLIKKLPHQSGKDKAICIERKPNATERQISAAQKAKVAEILPFPQWCWDNAHGAYWEFMNRRLSCMRSSGRVNVIQYPSGTVTGYVDFEQYDLITVHDTVAQFGHQQAISPLTTVGDGNKVTIAGGFSCVGWCIYGDQDYPLQVVDTNDLVEGSRVFYTTVNNPGEVGQIDTRLDIAWGAPGAIMTVTQVHGAQVRCDHAVPGVAIVGCVHPQFTPTYEYSKSGPYPELARHIENAQNSGLPGDSSGPPLHRLANQVLQDKNRDTSCPGRFNRPKDNTCDEYPMASTYEGGWTKGDLTVTETSAAPTHPWTMRSFDAPVCAQPGATWPFWDSTNPSDPNGTSACMINGDQNSNGGNALNNEMYRTQRVINLDPFYINIVP